MSAAPQRAIVRAPIAPLLAEPRASAEQVSQRLAGHMVDVLELRDAWMRVRGGDGYAGWVHEGYLARMSDTPARQSHGARRVSLGCVTTVGGASRALPLGAYLSPEEAVASGAAVLETELPQRFPRNAASLARAAQEFFEGASYQWGGIAPWGADCSGFVQTLFWLHGIALPRDARQQAAACAPSDAALPALRIGDLAFFSSAPQSDRISHVGLGVGDGRMAHVAIGRGGFAIERLSNQGDPYVRSLLDRFQLARSPLDGVSSPVPTEPS